MSHQSKTSNTKIKQSPKDSAVKSETFQDPAKLTQTIKEWFNNNTSDQMMRSFIYNSPEAVSARWQIQFSLDVRMYRERANKPIEHVGGDELIYGVMYNLFCTFESIYKDLDISEKVDGLINYVPYEREGRRYRTLSFLLDVPEKQNVYGFWLTIHCILMSNELINDVVSFSRPRSV